MNQVQQAFYVPKEEERGGSMYLTWAGLRVCDAQHFVGPRILPNYKAVLVVCGNGYIELEGRTVRLGKGDLFFLFPNVKHHYYADPQNPWVLQWFTYNGGNAQSIMNSLRISEKSPVLHSCMARPLMTCMELILDCMKGSQARPMVCWAMRTNFSMRFLACPPTRCPRRTMRWTGRKCCKGC